MRTVYDTGGIEENAPPAAMKLSIYTFVKDGLYYDFHVVAMLRHHLPLADEIVVVEGYSTDGTYDAIRNIDPKIQVHRSHGDRSDPNAWHRKFKNEARQKCTGDWCILLDCDEFIPEWEFDRLRRLLDTTDKLIVPVRFTHFYGSYRVYIERLPAITPLTGLRIHRNLPDLQVWGDGANVHLVGRENDESLIAADAVAVHHFGTVRHAARLRQKWRVQAKQHDAAKPTWDRTPGFMFDMFPYRWDDPDYLPRLEVYEGPYIQAVRDDPEEFTRDDHALYQRLKKSPV
jgi:glycosyltransferase involved in cell wall biosynthesis